MNPMAWISRNWPQEVSQDLVNVDTKKNEWIETHVYNHYDRILENMSQPFWTQFR